MRKVGGNPGRTFRCAGRCRLWVVLRVWWIKGIALHSIAQSGLWEMAVRHRLDIGIVTATMSIFIFLFSMIRNSTFFLSRIEGSKDYEDYHEGIFWYYLFLIIVCVLPGVLLGAVLTHDARDARPDLITSHTIVCFLLAIPLAVLTMIFWWIRRRR